MTTAVLATPPFLAFYDNNGNPLAGGLVYTYAAGTNAPKATFTDQTALVEMPNPIVLDSAGRATWWINGAYKYVVTDILGNVIKTTDNVTSFSVLTNAVTPFFQIFSGNGSQTAFTLTDDLGVESKSLMIFLNRGLEQNVTNGDFATDTDWTKGAGWTIGSGVATATGGISTAISQTAAVTLVEGQAYAITYTITRTAGSLIPTIGGRTGFERNSAGTYSEVIVCGGTQEIAFTGNGFTGTLDNVSVTVAATAGYDIISPSAYTLNGTDLTFLTAPPVGVNNIYVFAPSSLLGAASGFAAQAQASANDALAFANAASIDANDAAASAAAALVSENNAASSETNAGVSEVNAAQYAVDAQLAGTSLIATSTSSVAIGTGAKTFTVEAGKNFLPTQGVLIVDNANSNNWMLGQVTSYSSTTLITSIAQTSGSGTISAWNISAVTGLAGGLDTVRAGDGTAAAPSYSFAADTNTGLRRPHNDAISIVTGGVDRMWTDSNGRIAQGLGVTAGDSGTLVATGISNANRPNFQSHVSNPNNGGIASYQWDNSGAAAWTHFLKARGGVIGTHTAVQNGDAIGWMRFGGSDGTQFIEGARFTVVTDDTIGTGDVPMGYRWATKAAGASLGEKMRLDSAGRLGIGTTPNANALFHVVTTTRQSIPAPVMTTAQKNALTPVNGGMVYDDTLKSPSWYNGTAWRQPSIMQRYTSPDQTITAGGSLNLTHGLGVRPFLIQAYLKCITAEAGYAIGDVVPTPINISSTTGSNQGVVIVPDATELFVRYGSGGMIIMRKDTGASFSGTITPANWRLVVEAFA